MPHGVRRWGSLEAAGMASGSGLRNQMDSDRPALAVALDLAPHPEGGWFRETWRSAMQFEPEGYEGPRAVGTGIHFLLMPGEVSAPHVVRSDELWLWHRGGPLLLTIGECEIVLAPDVESGQLLQAVVPGGVVRSGTIRPGELYCRSRLRLCRLRTARTLELLALC